MLTVNKRTMHSLNDGERVLEAIFSNFTPDDILNNWSKFAFVFYGHVTCDRQLFLLLGELVHVLLYDVLDFVQVVVSVPFLVHFL